MQEIWKDVIGYEGYYKVSNLGRVQSVSRTIEVSGKNQFGNCFCKKSISGKVLKPCEYHGYFYVSLYKEHKMHLVKIHRLVAEAFIGVSDLTVNHIDGNKQNNCVTNLEYLTSADNTKHAIMTGLRDSVGESNPNHKLTKEDVIKIRVRKLNNEPKEQVFLDYSKIVSYVTFEKIWYGMTWKSVIV